jgi:hypothetical protein
MSASGRHGGLPPSGPVVHCAAAALLGQGPGDSVGLSNTMGGQVPVETCS